MVIKCFGTAFLYEQFIFAQGLTLKSLCLKILEVIIFKGFCLNINSSVNHEISKNDWEIIGPCN